MELNPWQLSSLKDMGIPVWEFRSNESEHTPAEVEQANFTEMSEQLLKSEWVVVIDDENYSEQAQSLLHAMLLAIGIDEQKLAIITLKQVMQLQNIPSQNKVLFVLGEAVARIAFSESICRDLIHQTLNTNIKTVVSFSLNELLENPVNKALAWHDLQLAKQALLQS